MAGKTQYLLSDTRYTVVRYRMTEIEKRKNQRRLNLAVQHNAVVAIALIGRVL